MGRVRLTELINISSLKKMAENIYAVAGIPVDIISIDGTILKSELDKVSLDQKELMNVNKYMLSLMIFNHMKENNRQEYWSVIFFNVHYKTYF